MLEIRLPAARAFAWPLRATASALAALALVPTLFAGEPSATAKVKLETVAVRAAMDPESEVRQELKQGEVVRVELEFSGGPNGSWTAIADLEGRRLGYVPSAALERKAAPSTAWQAVRSERSRPSSRPAANTRVAAAPKRTSSEVQVEFFAASWCRWCDRTRELLRSLGVSVTEYDIDAQPARKAELVARSGSTTVPFLDIEGITITGFGQAAIRKAVEERRAAR